jgi:hypothetical protein
MYLALCLLLGVCAIYTNGTWFFVVAISVLLALIIVFIPIYLCKYKVFSKVKRFGDFISLAVDFIVLNLLLIIINYYTNGVWYFNFALPIVSIAYVMLNALLSIRFLRVNKLIKTSVIIFLSAIFVYLPPLFLKVSNVDVQKEINDLNIRQSNLSVWNTETINNNVHLIICLTAFLMGLCFTIAGLIKGKK